MPVYEYECAPCRSVYEVLQPASDAPLRACPACQGNVSRIASAPNLNCRNFTSPTQARYARVSRREELGREAELQREYQRIWLPPPVKHSPWDD